MHNRLRSVQSSLSIQFDNLGPNYDTTHDVDDKDADDGQVSDDDGLIS